tara:strand:- start:5234 stop:6193 length:960 start_codon:yes stop_codon:yes gene_type:complete
MKNKVNTFIIGQPRCGTTSLYSYLKMSRDVFLPSQKQLYHFEKDYNDYRKKRNISNRLLYNYYNYNIENYLSNFKRYKNQKIIVDITPSYLFSSVSAKEIYNYNPNAKFIAIFRNPIDYVNSIHMLLYLNKIEHIPNLVDAVKASKIRYKKHFRQTKDEMKEIANYYERIKYAKQLNRYFELFKKDNIKILFYEDFKKNNQKFINEICQFLGISNINIENKIESNVSRSGKFNFLISVKNSNAFRKISFLIPSNIRRLLGKVFKILVTKKNKYKITEIEREFLKKEFNYEIVEFAEILKKNGYIKSKLELENKWNLNLS